MFLELSKESSLGHQFMLMYTNLWNGLKLHMWSRPSLCMKMSSEFIPAYFSITFLLLLRILFPHLSTTFINPGEVFTCIITRDHVSDIAAQIIYIQSHRLAEEPFSLQYPLHGGFQVPQSTNVLRGCKAPTKFGTQAVIEKFQLSTAI